MCIKITWKIGWFQISKHASACLSSHISDFIIALAGLNTSTARFSNKHSMENTQNNHSKRYICITTWQDVDISKNWAPSSPKIVWVGEEKLCVTWQFQAWQTRYDCYSVGKTRHAVCGGGLGTAFWILLLEFSQMSKVETNLWLYDWAYFTKKWH